METTQQLVYKLNSKDLEKIGKGALLAMAGALVTYASTTLFKVNFGVYTPLVTAVIAILLNAARKVLDGTQS